MQTTRELRDDIANNTSKASEGWPAAMKMLAADCNELEDQRDELTRKLSAKSEEIWKLLEERALQFKSLDDTRLIQLGSLLRDPAWDAIKRDRDITASHAIRLLGERDSINAKLDAEMAISAGLRERIASLEAGGLNQKPFLYALAEIDGTPFLDEGCVSNIPDQLDISGSELNILPVYTGPQVIKMAEERDRLLEEANTYSLGMRQMSSERNAAIAERDAAVASRLSDINEIMVGIGRPESCQSLLPIAPELIIKQYKEAIADRDHALDDLRDVTNDRDRLREELAQCQSDRQREHDLRVRMAGERESYAARVKELEADAYTVAHAIVAEDMKKLRAQIAAAMSPAGVERYRSASLEAWSKSQGGLLALIHGAEVGDQLVRAACSAGIAAALETYPDPDVRALVKPWIDQSTKPSTRPQAAKETT